MNQEIFFKHSTLLGSVYVRTEKMLSMNSVLSLLAKNAPLLDGYECVPSLSVTYFDATREHVKNTLQELDIQTEKLINGRSNTTIWNCSEEQRLLHMPGKCYIIIADCDGKKDFVHIHGGYYLKSKSGEHPSDIIAMFQKNNPTMSWGWIFLYNPSDYFVYPQCLIQDVPKDEPLAPLQKRRQFKSVQQHHFRNDVILMGQNATLEQLETYCANNLISYYALYARFGSICCYAFRVLNQDDMDYAQNKSRTEGYLCWICASKVSSDEFEN